MISLIAGIIVTIGIGYNYWVWEKSVFKEQEHFVCLNLWLMLLVGIIVWG